ncbi:hypothetical protein Tco_1154828 [Tanacetum coccineum]
MNPVITQQVALDNALVAPEKRLKIEKCNARIEFNKPQREATYQVTLDSLKLSPSYPAFLITADVPEICMHQFWNTIKKIKDTDAYNFKLDKKKCKVDTKELGYSCKCEMLSAIHTGQMHQPWRTFAPIINRCISGITTGLDRLRESRAQILWGMFKQKNVDYVALLWEDFMYQADSREISSARKEHIPYSRFTKVIINHFISQDKTISMRNRINLHTVRNDTLLGTLKFVSKTEDSQKYRALIPDGMVNQDIKDSTAYKTYYDFATGKVIPKKERKFKKVVSPSRTLSPVLEPEPAKKTKRVKRHVKKSTTTSTAGVIIRHTPGVSVSKKKAPAKADRGKGIELLSDVALLKDAQLKKVLDEHEDKTTGTDEGTGSKPGVPDVPTYESESKNESWGDSQDDKSNDVDSDDDNNSDNKDDDSKNDDEGDSDVDDCERTDSDSDSDEEVNLNLNSKDDEEEETQDDEYIRTPDYYVPTDEESYTELEKEGKGDAEMTYAGLKDVSQEKTYEQVIDDAHVTFTSTQKTDADSKVASLMNVKTHQEDSSTQAPFFLTVHVKAILETSLVPSTKAIKISYTAEFEKKALEEKDRYIDVIEKSIKGIIKDEVKSQFPQILPKEVSDFATPVIQSIVTESLENIILAKSSSQPKSYRAVEQHKDLYDALVKSYQLDKDLFDSYGKAYSLKRGREDKNKDEDPLAGSDQGLKKRKTSKDAETSKGSKSKDSKSSSSKHTKTQPKSGKSAQAEEPMFEAADTEMPHNQGTNVDQTYLVGPAFDLLKGTCKSRVKLEYHFKECYKVVNDRLDWTNLEGQEYSFDLSKTLLLIEVQGRQVVPTDYFINNDLEYLEEIEVRREDQTLYKFKEGDFPNLNLCDIKDMLLLLFSDGMLTSVRTILHDIASNLRMEYLPMRRWSERDRLRSHIMIKKIDKQFYERRLMRNLEKFVSGREYGEDFKLLERTI